MSGKKTIFTIPLNATAIVAAAQICACVPVALYVADGAQFEQRC